MHIPRPLILLAGLVTSGVIAAAVPATAINSGSSDRPSMQQMHRQMMGNHPEQQQHMTSHMRGMSTAPPR